MHHDEKFSRETSRWAPKNGDHGQEVSQPLCVAHISVKVV